MQAVAMDNQRIPMPSTSLVGRAEEIARLTNLLLRPDELTVWVPDTRIKKSPCNRGNRTLVVVAIAR